MKPAPCGRHRVELRWEGEYSQGNFFYALMLDGQNIGRDVLDAAVWSPDGRYFAIAEIAAGTNPRDGRFAALVIDVEQRHCCSLTHPAGHGLLPQSFDDGQLVCRVWQTGAEHAADVGAVKAWQALTS